MRPLLIAFGVMSLISLAVYGADKARAQSRRWRIPESFSISPFSTIIRC